MMKDAIGYINDTKYATDYYPFGMGMPNRYWSAGEYRFGFNGKENDNEVKGEGNEQDYGMRIYDPRLGRFLSLDLLTKKYPELTPYQFASNRPIISIDIDGLEAEELPEENRMEENNPEVINRREAEEGLKPSETNPNIEEELKIKETDPTEYYRRLGETLKNVSNTEQDPIEKALGKLLWNQMFPPIKGARGIINVQSTSPEAMNLRQAVKSGSTLYRLGTSGISLQGQDAQYWSTINPLINPNEYAESMGIPKLNVVNKDFVETAVLKPGYNFIVNQAPAASGETGGGGLQVVVPWGGTMQNQIIPLK